MMIKLRTPLFFGKCKHSLRIAFITVVATAGTALAQVNISNGLVGYYDFESDFGNQVTGASALPDGVAQNTPIAGSNNGRVGKGMLLQGAQNDHMRLTASFGDGNTLGKNFTISAWYKLNDPITSSNSSDRYFVYEATNNYDISYGIRNSSEGVAGINDGQVYMGSGGNFVIADAAVSGWHHIAQKYTEDGTDIKVETFIDGKFEGELTIASGSFNGAGLNFGAARSTTTNRGFDGMIDEVAIWNRDLSSIELAVIYAKGLNGTGIDDNAGSDPEPVITNFTASPSELTAGAMTTLNWTVTGASSVTIVDEVGNVALTGTIQLAISESKEFTLVAINGNSVKTAQVSLTVSGPTDPVGPLVGTVKKTEAYLLYRPGEEEVDLRLTVKNAADVTVATVDSSTLATNDYVAKFHVTGLEAETQYFYRIDKVETNGDLVLYAGNSVDYHFTTALTKRLGEVYTAAFISCVNDTTDEVWAEMANHNLDMLVLAGDTPYVDTGTLSTINDKHRHFLQRPNLTDLIRNKSVIGTWDDHDFGLNGGNGVSTASRKVNTRKGFVNYRIHDQYGDGAGNGVYHKADMGPIEIFMLDPRWFSQTEASPIDANQSTCFGSAQWQWLLDSIRNSKAPFKVLVQGQIWQDKKNGETDDMFTYYKERDALLNIIRDEKIPGVVIFGGDIHVARQMMHPRRVGYDLYDFIMSPGHKSVISSLNVYHPSLEWSREQQNQFLTMKADTTKEIPELTVRYMDKDGVENHKVVIKYSDLSYNEGAGLSKDLRAFWSFDDDLKNQSVLGDRLDGTAENGANQVASGGILGGALNLDRASNQYLSIPRSFLDDNSSTYTVSNWCKASTLPAHGSTDRHFLMESYANNHVSLPQASSSGYAISIGIQTSATDSNKVNLQLHTETLVPRAVGSQQAPGIVGQGGYDFDIDRSLLTSWCHVAVTFDASKLRLFINGALAIEHNLTTEAAIAETGGLIIGGHRSGTGRNFDGMIDEVAIWNRVLTNTEITSLYNSGNAVTIDPTTKYVDSDNDGIPDWWEEVNGLDSTDASDGNTDGDADGFSAFQEFGFGTDPTVKETTSPFTQGTMNVGGTEYQTLTYQRNPLAMSNMTQDVQRTSSLSTTSAWDAANTVLVEVGDLPNGLQQVTVRSTLAMNAQPMEFMRVQFLPILE